MDQESLGYLLIDFFEYYHDKFPYTTSFISVLQGGLFPKESKGWVREKQPDALSIESIIDPGMSCFSSSSVSGLWNMHSQRKMSGNHVAR